MYQGRMCFGTRRHLSGKDVATELLNQQIVTRQLGRHTVHIGALLVDLGVGQELRM